MAARSDLVNMNKINSKGKCFLTNNNMLFKIDMVEMEPNPLYIHSIWRLEPNKKNIERLKPSATSPLANMHIILMIQTT